MSNQLIKKTNQEVEKVFPKTYIHNITDKSSNKTLAQILNSFNMYFLSYTGNVSATRCLVPMILRKKGLWITYVKYDGNIYTEWYAASDIDDESWGDSSNWRIGNNMLVGDITISANGNWIINGTETEFKAIGEKGNTPLIRIADNKLQVSYDLGDTYSNVTENFIYTQFRFNSQTNTYQISYDLGSTWQDVSNDKVYHQFRTNDNKLQVSTDLGTTWENCSEPIAAWFRWADASGTGNVGKVQISRDNNTWEDLSPIITNNLYIKGYVAAVGNLPSNAAIGDIYMVGPTYDESDTTHDYPHYRMWVKQSSGWIDNGEFTNAGPVGTNNIINGSVTIEKVADSAIDDGPTAGSNNLVKSGGVADKISELENKIFGKYIEQPNKSNVLHGYVGVDGTWNNNTFWCVFIPVDKLRGLKITQKGGLGAQYAFLKNKSTNYAVKNEFVEGGSRVDSKPENVTIPNDANFLYLFIATGDTIPEVYPTLLLNDKSIVKEVEEIKSKIDILTNDVNELKSIGIEGKLQEVNTKIDITTTVVENINNELTTVNQEVDNLNTTVEKIVNKSIASYKENSAYTTKTQTSSIFNFAEKEPILKSMNVNSIVKHYGRNRFNIETAVFEVPSYVQYHSITKENKGVKIQCNVDYNKAITLVRTAYIAEFDGDLYISTEADCVGLINDVAMIVHVNDVAQTRIYGKGLLYECVSVRKGDNVRLSLYTHINTSKVNTLFYKNIMFAYGGLYNYSEFKETESNLIKTSKTLPTNADFYENSNTSQSGKYRINSLSLDFLPKSVLPTSQDVKANIIVDGALPLITYNEVFQCTPGIGVSNNGRISIYHDGEGKVQLCEWLKNNPITIKFDGEEYDINFSPTVQQGDILEFAIPSEVSYSYKKTIKDKTLVCFGDSITGMFDNNTDYPSMIAQAADIHCYNVGFAGCQFTDHSDARYMPFSMNRLVDAIISKDFSLQDTGASQLAGLYAKRLSVLKEIDFSKIDFVTIFYGTNDWGSNKILESKDDESITNKQRTNVEDAVNYCIDNLLTHYPNLKIIVITPYWRAIEIGKDSDVDANGRGNMLFDFSGKIAEISRKFNLPTIDLYHKFGANKYTNRYYTTDGTHPTEWAKHSIAHRIIDVINKCS